MSKALLRALQRGDADSVQRLLQPQGGWTARLTKNGDCSLHLLARFRQPQLLATALGTQRPGRTGPGAKGRGQSQWVAGGSRSG